MTQYFYKLLWICFLISHCRHVYGARSSETACGIREAKPLPEIPGKRRADPRPRPQPRIHGGVKAYINQFPWAVTLRSMIYLKGVQCGGAIIAKHWVITAASCLKGPLKPRYVTPGSSKGVVGLFDNGKWEIKKYHVHPSYSKGAVKKNDIALLELYTKLNWDPLSIQPICVSRNDVTEGQACEVVGWGETGSGLAQWLQKFDATIPASTRCGEYEWMYPDMICTYRKYSSGYGCYADSGGPLMCKESNGRMYLKGVMSSAGMCTLRKKTTLFMKVAHYVDWIEQVTGLKFDEPVAHPRLHKQPELNETDGAPGRNELYGQPASNEYEGQPGSNARGRPPRPNERGRPPGPNEPEGQPGPNEPERQPGPNEPEGQSGRSGLTLSVHNGLDNKAGSPMSSNPASMPMTPIQMLLFVGVPTLTIGLIALMVVVVLYRKSPHQKDDILELIEHSQEPRTK